MPSVSVATRFAGDRSCSLEMPPRISPQRLLSPHTTLSPPRMLLARMSPPHTTFEAFRSAPDDVVTQRMFSSPSACREGCAPHDVLAPEDVVAPDHVVAPHDVLAPDDVVPQRLYSAMPAVPEKASRPRGCVTPDHVGCPGVSWFCQSSCLATRPCPATRSGRSRGIEARGKARWRRPH